MSEPDSVSAPSQTLAQDAAPLKLPLDAWHRAQGARMVPFAGYEMPLQYEGIKAEHLWTRSSASLFDVSHMGQLWADGQGAEAALEALMPADLGALALDHLRYSLLLNEAGGILDDLIVTRRAGGFFLVVNGAVKAADTAHLREHLPASVSLNELNDRALLALQGPKAAAALSRHVAEPDELNALGFMQGGEFSLGGSQAWISRSGYSGEDGFEISIPVSEAARTADMLCAESEVKPAGLGARDSLRLEAGLPLYGHDLTTSTNPVAAGLTFALSKSRRETGGWMGYEPVMKTLAEGPAQKRVGLMLDGRQPAREGAEIFAGSKQVGVVTSGGYSPSLEAPIAMGYVDAASASPGTSLEIEVRGKRLPASIVKMPFVPHQYHRKGDR